MRNLLSKRRNRNYMFTKIPGIMYSNTNSGQLLTSRNNFQVLMNPLPAIFKNNLFFKIVTKGV